MTTNQFCEIHNINCLYEVKNIMNRRILYNASSIRVNEIDDIRIFYRDLYLFNEGERLLFENNIIFKIKRVKNNPPKKIYKNPTIFPVLNIVK